MGFHSMKVSELIKKLVDWSIAEGDVEVVFQYQGQMGGYHDNPDFDIEYDSEQNVIRLDG